MEGVLKDVLTSQPILQIFAGGVALMVVAYMVMRGTKDREPGVVASPSLPAPAPGGIGDVPAIFAQGPRELLDTFRQMREDVRTMAENSRKVVEELGDIKDDLSTIKDDLRDVKSDGHQRTDILRSIDKEQIVANRSRHPGRDS
jgi:hypothetical protein